MFYTYITTNPAKTTYYTGMTNNITRRMQEHKENKGNRKTFAGKYYCYKLIYYETFEKPMEAINRETEIKKLSRVEKEELIKSKNPKMNFIRV
jgi:putative endonuclease